MIIGKGGLREKTATACKEFGCLYCVIPAGNAVLAAICVERIEQVEWRDLGMPEVLWNCTVKEFGPLIVSIDAYGSNLFEENLKVYECRKEEQIKRISNQVRFIK